MVSVIALQLHYVSAIVAVVIRLGTQEAEGLSKSDVAKRMKVTDVFLPHSMWCVVIACMLCISMGLCHTSHVAWSVCLQGTQVSGAKSDEPIDNLAAECWFLLIIYLSPSKRM